MNKIEEAVINYYNTPESKYGYGLFLGGTKHFGYYKNGDWPWQINKSLRQMEEMLASKLSLTQGAKVLDGGCGVGDVASYIAANEKATVTGIDILDFNIIEARRRIKARGLEKSVDVRLMSYEQLDFPPGTFDAIYTMETFVHASHPEKVLTNFYKALKPGGKLVMFEYSRDPDAAMSERAKKMFEFINHHAAMPAFQRFTHGTQETLMKEAGFTSVKVEDISNRIAPMMRLFRVIAFVPYLFISLLNMRSKYVNIMSAVEFYRYNKHIKYNIYTATKT